MAKGKVLLFHVNLFKAGSIETLCHDLQLEPVKIQEEQMGETLGTLAGLPGGKNSGTDSGRFAEEMMVFCGITPDQLDAFLDNYQKRGIHPISLKAVLTPVNALWTPLRLSRELMKERDAFSGTSS